MSEPNTSLVAAPENRMARLTVAEVVARVQLVQNVMATLMKKDVHYGVIPGTKKPSLWQPGAELLMVTFQFSPDQDLLRVEDLSGLDDKTYRVVMPIRHVPTGLIYGVGVGECSTNEEKYKWRRCVCQEEFDETPTDRRRLKWAWDFQGKKGYSIKQVRTEPADLANTVLKMAKKRALVDGAKGSTGASDIFDQDLEDLPEGLRQEANGGEAPKTVGTPKSKGAQKSPPPTEQTTTQPADAAAGDGDSNLGASIPAEAWEEVKATLHTKGFISSRQQKRLFTRAAQKGWKDQEVAAVVCAALGIGGREVQEEDGERIQVLNLPHSAPYEKTVAIFDSFGPAR